MAEKIIVLNEEDADIFRRLLAREKRRSADLLRAPSIDIPDDNTTQCYFARTPDAGIPGLAENTTGTGTGTVIDDDVVGYAECSIYKLDGTGASATFEPYDDIDQEVYNVFAVDIPGNTWVPIVRHKAGHWLATAAIDSTWQEPDQILVSEIDVDLATVQSAYADEVQLRNADGLHIDIQGQGITIVGIYSATPTQTGVVTTTTQTFGGAKVFNDSVMVKSQADPTVDYDVEWTVGTGTTIGHYSLWRLRDGVAGYSGISMYLVSNDIFSAVGQPYPYLYLAADGNQYPKIILNRSPTEARVGQTGNFAGQIFTSGIWTAAGTVIINGGVVAGPAGLSVDRMQFFRGDIADALAAVEGEPFFDTSTNKLYVQSGGAWREIGAITSWAGLTGTNTTGTIDGGTT